ncbi:MAG: hypothetical protein LBF61_06040 [Azoarcus sp.]|nr:hypothetical protein [Azoarcus sp.]
MEGRWIVPYFGPWLDARHPRPAVPGEIRWFAAIDGKDIEVKDGTPFQHGQETIRPQSRTFIASRITDNPYLLNTGYMATLQALPEPLRSQMLEGDFRAGMQDSPWQVIPTAWVEAAQARWRVPDRRPPMDSMGVDVARGGEDETVIARRHGMWFDVPLAVPGAQTPNGAEVAGRVVASRRNDAVVHIDVIGVGASPYDILNGSGIQTVGVNVAQAATGLDSSGRLSFRNLRSMLWWRMREALDPINETGICLPPGARLTAELCAPTWSLRGSTIYVASREEIIKTTGRSPDYASAYVLALMDTPKNDALEVAHGNARRNYDPWSRRD